MTGWHACVQVERRKQKERRTREPSRGERGRRCSFLSPGTQVSEPLAPRLTLRGIRGSRPLTFSSTGRGAGAGIAICSVQTRTAEPGGTGVGRGMSVPSPHPHPHPHRGGPGARTAWMLSPAVPPRRRSPGYLTKMPDQHARLMFLSVSSSLPPERFFARTVWDVSLPRLPAVDGS